VKAGIRSGIELIVYSIEDCSGWFYCQPIKMEQITEPMMVRLLDIMEKFVAKMMTKLDAYQEKTYTWIE
jgi:hypothetical protein